jgi:DNA-binding NtrC family response regulator
VGGAEDVPIDVRILCATRRDLLAEVASGHFREDLYFRLVVYPIELPPLRERRGDVLLLVEDILRRLNAGGRQVRVHPRALSALTRYPWPGNVRELINVLQRALLLRQGEEITLAELPACITARPGATPIDTQGGGPAVTPLRELERSAIEHALASAGGRVDQAAKLLGISRATLYRRMAGRTP